MHPTNQENQVMSSRANDSFHSIDINLLDAVTGAGDINWGNAAAQAGIWGLAGGATAAVTGVGAPLAWAAAGVGAAAGFGSAVVGDLLN
jgi:hypothetical protein